MLNLKHICCSLSSKCVFDYFLKIKNAHKSIIAVQEASMKDIPTKLLIKHLKYFN